MSGLLTACEQDQGELSKPAWYIPLLCVQWKTPDDGQKNCPKHVEFYSENKFEKSVHLVAHMGEERRVYRVLVGKPGGRRSLGKPRSKWVDNIRIDLKEVGCGYMDWIGLAQDRDRWRTLVSVVMNLRVPWNAVNFLTCCKPVSFSRRTLHHGVSKCI